MQPAEVRCGRQNQEPPQIWITLLADVAQPFFAAARSLARHQPDPGGKITARLEHPTDPGSLQQWQPQSSSQSPAQTSGLEREGFAHASL